MLGLNLPDVQQIHLRHLFYLMDADGDGTLDWEEPLGARSLQDASSRSGCENEGPQMEKCL
jgi:hypothetical protein